MSEKTKELVSNLIYDRYKYQEIEFYSSKRECDAYIYLEELSVKYFFEYKKYLFLERKTDSDLVFYKFCSKVEAGETPGEPGPSAAYHLRTITQFIDENLWMFENVFGDELQEHDKQIEKVLDIILTRINDLRKQDK